MTTIDKADPIADYNLDEVRAAIDMITTAIDDKADTTKAVRDAFALITGHLPADYDLDAVALDLLTDLARHLSIQNAQTVPEEHPGHAYRRLMKLAEEDIAGRDSRYLAIAAEYRLAIESGAIK